MTRRAIVVITDGFAGLEKNCLVNLPNLSLLGFTNIYEKVTGSSLGENRALDKVYASYGYIESGLNNIDDMLGHGEIFTSLKGKGGNVLETSSFDELVAAVKNESDNRGIIVADLSDEKNDDYLKRTTDFDAKIMTVLDVLSDDDILFISSPDYGAIKQTNDDEKKYVPVLMCCKSLPPVFLGKRRSCHDIAKTISRVLVLDVYSQGDSFF